VRKGDERTFCDHVRQEMISSDYVKGEDVIF
jgi:hypothetical protein